MDSPITRMLVYLDGSDESVVAMTYAIVLAKRLGAGLTALYVINTSALQELVEASIFLKSEEEEYRKALSSDAERYLRHAKRLGEKKGIAVKTHTASGAVSIEINRVLAETGSDLLVVGGITKPIDRRNGRIHETERAIRSVSCPTIVVKDEARSWKLYESLE